MSDKPILFSAPMVRALLAGTKTQTRRLIDFKGIDEVMDFVKVATDPQGRPVYEMKGRAGQHIAIPAGKHLVDYNWSPRIGVGDRLWVREAWRTLQKWDDLKPSYLGDDISKITFEADPEHRNKLWAFGKLRPSMFMPRWGSRLTLIVTDVRVERLQDISEIDAKAEGVSDEFTDYELYGQSQPYRFGYSSLWNLINGEGAWDANPWVVAYTFSVQHGNIDQIAKVAA